MYTIVTKEDCPWCVKAKKVLKENHMPFEEISIPDSISKEEFYAMIENHDTPKTVPKIFNGKELIGGYEELIEWIDGHSGGYGKSSI